MIPSCQCGSLLLSLSLSSLLLTCALLMTSSHPKADDVVAHAKWRLVKLHTGPPTNLNLNLVEATYTGGDEEDPRQPASSQHSTLPVRFHADMRALCNDVIASSPKYCNDASRLITMGREGSMEDLYAGMASVSIPRNGNQNFVVGPVIQDISSTKASTHTTHTHTHTHTPYTQYIH